MNCPCHTGEQYDDCCGRFITQQSIPENAVQLMRSRYSAYALHEPEYLMKTWHPDHRPERVNTDSGLKWINLTIHSSSKTGDEAKVNFEAVFISNGKVGHLHENSHFVRENGEWYYTYGEMLEPTQKSWKPDRSDPCPCGSELKFKRCCGVKPD